MILEPVTGNMGVTRPDRLYLESVISMAERFGALAIFDEVMSGFRVSAGGAQGLFSLQPHLTCLGKIVGGGLPIGAYGGRGDIMGLVAPEGPVYQAGTLSGNPLAVTAGLRTLELLEQEDPYPVLERRSARLCQGLEDVAGDSGLDVQVQRCGSMFTLFFNSNPVLDYRTALDSDTGKFARYFHKMLACGIYWAPSQFEACFLSTAHGDAEIDRTIECAGKVLGNSGGPERDSTAREVHRASVL